jgi:peptidoglycan/LPS O-acetylase OafA/YrhL
MHNKETYSPKKIFFPNLDGLRFFAFFLVFLSHGLAVPSAGVQDQGILLIKLKDFIFNSGWAGVSFFFVLSGFLITYLILTEIKVIGNVDVKAFYIRRILRIWPLYYLVLLFGFVVYPLLKNFLGFSSNMEAANPLYYLFFLSNFGVIQLGQGHGAIFTNITWSVAIEEQFYLVWPLLFFYTPPRFYKFLFPIIILISACSRFYFHNETEVIYYHSLSVISDMAVGGMAAYLALRFERFTEMIAQIPKLTVFSIYVVGLFSIVFRHDVFIGSVLGMLERLFISLFFVFIVLEQNYCHHSIFKMSSLKLISRLGIYTYGLYLLHPIAITILLSILKVLGIGSTAESSLGIGVAALLLSIAMSVISYHSFEKKFLKLKSRFTHISSAQTLPQ